MSPETDANDHVPLEFLLGARAKHYYPNTKHQERSIKVCTAKRSLPQSIHPRRRGEQARQLLQRVMDQADARKLDEFEVFSEEPDRAALVKALVEAASSPQEIIFDDENFQLSLKDTHGSPARIKTLQQLRNDELRRQNQRLTSFHGYERDSRSILDVTGAAARIPHTTIRQLREIKLSIVKARKKQEGKRTQELLEVLQGQQEHTRTALHQHQQFAKALQRQKNHGSVSTSLITLDSIGNQDNRIASNGWNEPGRKLIPTLQIPESYYDAHPFDERDHPRRPVLAKVTFDSLALSSSLPKHESTGGSGEESLFSSMDNEADFLNTGITWEADDDSDEVRRRLGDRQREVFVNNSANGLFFGGGFIAKKAKDRYEKKPKRVSVSNNSNHSTQAASEQESLEAVLGTQSASILPLAEANKPALRRREATASRRPNHLKPPNK
ncbi:hypothetical protein V7S43_002609 [Phytophthora oleae]|uniref:Uncharacterized protein n=1 Tax=Phytophthora oleae TaxID=2107226 RepID=A0ABD3FYF1_9STRA